MSEFLNPRITVIDYTNYRGERSLRTIMPIEIGFFEIDNYHGNNQWLLRAFDFDKGAERRFALKDIHSWKPQDQ